MAHEIMQHDGLVLHRERAWHGLGTIVQDALTPTEALKIARLDWTVEQWQLAAAAGGGDVRLEIPEQVANVRTDIRKVLGIVSKDYRPIQNLELAQFCELLADQGDVVKIESAGSIRNGAKVWFLLNGESFSVRGKDEVRPYICVSNGHDGGTALRCTTTSVRVVCSNTLHLVIPRNDGKDRKAEDPMKRSKLVPGLYVAAHTGDIKKKVDDARAALQLYNKSLDSTREMIDALAAKDLNRESVQQFFLQAFVQEFGEIPVSPKDAAEERQVAKATEGYNAFIHRFDSERNLAGATAWNAFNAFTGWMQNDRSIRTADPVAAAEKRMASKLFGVDGDRSVHAFELALTLAS